MLHKQLQTQSLLHIQLIYISSFSPKNLDEPKHSDKKPSPSRNHLLKVKSHLSLPKHIFKTVFLKEGLPAYGHMDPLLVEIKKKTSRNQEKSISPFHHINRV